MLNLPSTNTCSSRLANLPQELLNEIFCYLDDDADLICLALTCRHFLSVLGNQVRTALQTDAAPWAGGRIILLGDYAYDLPDGLLSESEESELSLEKQEDVEDYQEDSESPEELYRFAKNHYANCSGAKKVYHTVSSRLPDTEKTTLNQLCPVYPDTRETLSDQTWILRNLSSHEYVRADTLDSIESEPSLEPVGFGDVMMTRVQWTSDPSGVIAGGCEGAWAGDRFDITTLEKLVLEPGFESSWEDVSSMVVEDVERMHSLLA